jgi:protein gp37
MGQTKIEWCDKSWNPITGCSHAGSPGCDHCYAKRMAHRLQGRYGYPLEWKDDPFKVTFHPDRLDEPLHWKKSSRIFVVSMGDIFHDDVDAFWISAIWSIIERCYWHTFLILTKRPERWQRLTPSLPLYKNILFGVSVENQRTADERIPILLQIPAAKKFVSVEPMLQSINLMPFLLPKLKFNFQKVESVKLDWVICGSETGPKARPMNPDWARDLASQCQVAGVPFFFKQMSNKQPIPKDLMIKEFPK